MNKKKMIICLLVLVLIISGIVFAVAASNSTLSGTSVKKKTDNSPVKITVNECTSTTVEFVIENNSENAYVTVGNDYKIYSKSGSKWKEVDIIEDVPWDMIAYQVDDEQSMDIDWEEKYGSLENGEYLLAKECYIGKDKEMIYAEFEIK